MKSSCAPLGSASGAVTVQAVQITSVIACRCRFRIMRSTAFDKVLMRQEHDLASCYRSVR